MKVPARPDIVDPAEHATRADGRQSTDRQSDHRGRARRTGNLSTYRVDTVDRQIVFGSRPVGWFR